MTKQNKNKFISSMTLILFMSALMLTSVTLAGLSNTANAQTTNTYSIALSGDFDCGSSGLNSINTIKNNNGDGFIGLGDYAYEVNQDCWINAMGNAKILGLAQGNHESDENGSDQSWSQLKSTYPQITGDYYTINHKNTKIIVLNTQQSLAAGSAQFQFLQSNLEDCKTKKMSEQLDYCLIVHHKMVLSCDVDSNLGVNTGCSDHSMNELSNSAGIRNLLFQYQSWLDLVIQAHDHNSQLSKPVKLSNGQLVTTANNDNDAIVFGVFGSGGKTFDPLPDVNTKTFWQYLQGSTAAVSFLTFDTAGEKIGYKMLKSSDGSTLYENANLLLTGDDTTPPPQEICGNGIDDDNDGLIDEGCTTQNKEGKLNIVSASTATQDSGKEIQKSYDNDCDTRWSFSGSGSKGTFTFNNTYTIDKIKIDGYHQDKSYKFKLEGGNKEYTIPANSKACPSLEEFDIADQKIKNNKITIVGLGNSGSDYNSYRELQFFTKGDVVIPPPIEICGDGIDNDGDGSIDEGCPIPEPNGTKISYGITTSYTQDNKTKYDLIINSGNITVYPKLNNTHITILGYPAP